MIRLTVDAQSDPKVYTFNQATVSIGSDPNLVDVTLEGAHIQPIHLKITQQNNFLILINQVNDPFVFLNGNPFGKKLLNSGDVILVHHHQILFENLRSPSALDSDSTSCSQKELNETAHQKTQIEHSPPQSLFEPLPFEKEVEAFKSGEWKEADLSAYLKAEEKALPLKEVLAEPCLVAAMPLFKMNEQKKTLSLKDDYLRELDDDHSTPPSKEGEEFAWVTSEPSHLIQAWKWIISFILSLLIISGLIGAVIYFSVSDKTEAQETKAAQGVADIAMALMHAKLYHLKPHNQNWVDVDFLKGNLQAILPNTNSYASKLDAQGQLHCCPYNLRIYTNSDLSHFILIAQPAPSLLHWLIPKSVLVVDSQTMELRTLKDVRSLNRLLTNPDPLEGVNSKEISALIKQGGLVRLSSLAAESNQPDFAPPKNLGWMKPGAENFIYNAPRYYHVGQALIQKVLALSTAKGSSQEVAALKLDVESFSHLNHFILYADQGKKSALLTKQGLMTFAPSDKLLFGYLLFNNQGKIYQVHLLKEDEEFKTPSILLSREEDADYIAFELPVEKEAFEEHEQASSADSTSFVDFNHPIYIQLQAMTTAREHELAPLSTALTHLLNQELRNPKASFQIEFQNLCHAYLMVNAKHKQFIKEGLEALYHQYADMPVNQFIDFIKQLKLDLLIQPSSQSFNLVDENCLQNLETLLAHIEKSRSLVELENLVHMALTWLNFDYVKDPDNLIKYQNLLRNCLLARLEKHLLSQTHHLHVRAEDREILEHILSHENLIRTDEKEFFLGEFEELLAETKNPLVQN